LDATLRAPEARARASGEKLPLTRDVDRRSLVRESDRKSSDCWLTHVDSVAHADHCEQLRATAPHSGQIEAAHPPPVIG